MAESRTRPIRVVRVIARLNMGGPALHVSYLTAGLAERGYETTLVTGEVGPGEASMAFAAREAGVEPIVLPTLRREISPILDLISTTRLAELIRRIRPDIVHTHTAKAGAIGRVALALAAVEPRPLVVHTFHGHVLRGYFGRPVSDAFRLLERWLGGMSDALIAVSPQVRDDLVALGVAPASKFAVVRLGIELERRVAVDDAARRASRTLLGIPPSAFVVGWIGRMTAVKRVEDVLLAFRALRDRGVDAVLCTIGDGPDRDDLETRAHELGLARYCRYLGYQEDVAQWYAALDAVVLPSANEGTPVTTIEALAAGRPVVATRVGGVPDVIRDGEDGFLVGARDVGALADRLALLAADPELRERIGAAGRARVLRRYSVARLLDDVDRLYRDLLRTRGMPFTAGTAPSSRKTLR